MGLVVVLLREFVVGRSLFAGNKASEAELLARLLGGLDPLAEAEFLYFFWWSFIDFLETTFPRLFLNKSFLVRPFAQVMSAVPLHTRRMDPYLIRGLRGVRALRATRFDARRAVRLRLGARGVLAFRAALRVARRAVRLAARGTLAARRRVTRLVERRLTAILDVFP